MAASAVLALVGCMAFLTVAASAQPNQPQRLPQSTRATPAQPRNRSAGMRFDLRAQPLQGALDAYNEITGLSGFYSAESTAGHTTAAIRGWYTPDAVLRMLVENTGLVVVYTAPDAFVLEPAPSASSAQSDHDYDGLVQSKVRAAFCRDARIAPGDYRIAVSFRINAAGRAEQSVLLDTTGDKARDEAILDALRTLDIGLPPADAVRPFAMLILPRSLAPGRDCE